MLESFLLIFLLIWGQSSEFLPFLPRNSGALISQWPSEGMIDLELMQWASLLSFVSWSDIPDWWNHSLHSEGPRFRLWYLQVKGSQVCSKSTEDHSLQETLENFLSD